MAKGQLGTGVVLEGAIVVKPATVTHVPTDVAKQLISFVVNNADLAAGDIVTALTPGFAGKILSINAWATKAATTGSKAATITPKVNSTNVTGGALALTSATLTPQGAKVAGSAITAANVFTATDTIGLVVSAVTAFVEGATLIVVELENTTEKNLWAALKTHGLLL